MSESKGSKRSIQLKDRDLALLRGLFECRIMTIAHVAAIHFDGHAEYAKKRLQQLKAAGFIRERPRKVMEPSVLSLARDGFLLLRDHGVLAEYPQFSLPALIKRADVSDRTIQHELAVMDVKAAFHRAVRGSPILSIAEFGTWPRLYEFEAPHPTKGRMTVKPDGFLRIRESIANGTKEHVFYLEVDRSTETLDTVISKIGCYHAYYRSGGFAMRRAASRADFRQYPFRVLVVCKSITRQNLIAKRGATTSPQALAQTVLCTTENVLSDSLGSIWQRPLDKTGTRSCP